MKSTRGVIRLILVFWTIATLGGCGGISDSSPTGPLSALTVILSANKSSYAIGDTIIFTIKANSDCYLTLYNTKSTGVASQIFPNEFASDNLLTGGTTYEIPDENDMFDFIVTGPTGLEYVKAVVVDATNSNIQAEDTVSFQVVE